MTTFNQFQEAARLTAIYPGLGDFLDSPVRSQHPVHGLGMEHPHEGIAYLALGLNGEAGEVAEKIKKAIRDGEPDYESFIEAMKKELGDVLWYAAMLAHEVGVSFDDVASTNMDKLANRRDRGVLGGSGDER